MSCVVTVGPPLEDVPLHDPPLVVETKATRPVAKWVCACSALTTGLVGLFVLISFNFA